MSHLVIDIGNTSTKYAVVSDGRVGKMIRGNAGLQELRALVSSDEISSGICSSVRGLTPEESDLIGSLPFSVMHLSPSVRLPLTIDYRTPQTLGPDRLAAAVGAWSRMPGHNLLIIDAGTAITYDVVTCDGHFLGGNISPGAGLRFESLHEHTGRLPLVSADGDTPAIGYSTETAIRSGVISGIRDEIYGYIGRFSQMYGSLYVFLTGGDAELFEITIKNGIFADDFLVMEGLDTICSLNEKG